MKINMISQIVVGASILFGGIATPLIQNMQSQEAMNQISDNWLRLTVSQLSQYNGQNGGLAYLAFEGDIYDVTNASGFENGVHQGMHLAGQDVTDILPTAPHGTSILSQLTIIGELISDSMNSSSISTSIIDSSTTTTPSEVCVWIETDDALRLNETADHDDDDEWEDDEDEDEEHEDEDEEDEDDDWDDEDDEDGFWSCSGGGSTSGTTPNSSDNGVPISIPNTPSQDGKYYLTLAELSYYTGSNGRPAWIAVYGKIYDVTHEASWTNGVHRGIKLGGTDASSTFDRSPHSQTLLNSMNHIGFLVSAV